MIVLFGYAARDDLIYGSKPVAILVPGAIRPVNQLLAKLESFAKENDPDLILDDVTTRSMDAEYAIVFVSSTWLIVRKILFRRVPNNGCLRTPLKHKTPFVAL